MSQPIIYTVSRLNTVARLLLEQELGQVWLTAEISNLIQHSSGHWYFTLKDQNAQVKAAMFKGQNRRVAFRPQNGQQVLVSAQVSLYEARGDYQLIIDKMQPAGDGLLQIKLEELKAKLNAEGLFLQERKKSLPKNPQSIGLITSPTGAAIRDMLTVLARRNPLIKVVIYPTLVQGSSAAAAIIQSLHIAAQRSECDGYIIGRGGGSLEDLWCFNDEEVVRAIANFPLPIISAVGHETDTTLSDFAADMRAPTPSAAAELMSTDNQQQQIQLIQQQRHLTQSIQLLLKQENLRWQRLFTRLQRMNPRHQLQQKQLKQDDLQHRLERAIHIYLQRQNQESAHLSLRLEQRNPIKQISQLKIEQRYQVERLYKAMSDMLIARNNRHQRLISQLNALSPLNVLARGYSVTMNQQGKVIINQDQVTEGEQLTIHLRQGQLQVKALKSAN